MGKIASAWHGVWAWASHASLAQWLLTPIWGQVTAAASAIWVVVDTAVSDMPTSLTFLAGLATYVLVLTAINQTMALWRRWFSRETGIAALWRLRKEGIELRLRRLDHFGHLVDWIADVEKWRGHLLDAAQKVDRNLREWLENLGETEPPPNMPVISPQHATWIRIMSEILRRLEKYLRSEVRFG